MGEEFKKSRRGDRTVSQGGASRGRTGGMIYPATIAERIEAICLAFASVDGLVMTFHGDAKELPIGNAVAPTFCYLDPPYVGATGYGWNCSRGEVLAMAKAWASAGAVVAASEAEPIDLPGWHHLDLTQPGGKPEWLTLSRKPSHVPSRQRELFPATSGEA